MKEITSAHRERGASVSLTREAVYAKVQSLLLEPVEIAGSDNLLELGLDSLKIMRLASEWRRLGAPVSFAGLIESPCLDDWFSMVLNDCVAQSPCPCDDGGGKGVDGPFALTDVQYAYWVGRRDGQPLGGVGCHAYLEFDGQCVDPKRLHDAWNTLIAHHPMLRARFLEEGMQEIGEKGPNVTMPVHDLQGAETGAVRGHLDAIRQRLSHRRLAVEKGEVAGLELTLLPHGRSRIHLDVDLLVADVQSLHIMLRDLAAAYTRKALPKAPADWSFSRYLTQNKLERRAEREQAEAYWAQRIEHMPGAPGLPLAQTPESLGVPTFRRRVIRLDKDVWRSIRRKAAGHQITPAMVLLTMYAHVLARWSCVARFLINIPIFDRLSGMDGVEDVIADFTNVLLLEVDAGIERTFLEQLNAIKEQFQKDIAHSSYSGVQVQRDIARLRQGERMVAPVVFACNLGTPLLTEDFQEGLGELHYMISQTPQVWLDFQIYESDDSLLLAWDAVEGLFPEGLIDDMFAAYGRMATWLAREDNDWQSVPSLLPEGQRRRREQERAVQPLERRCLHLPFFAHAKARPDRVALMEDKAANGTVTYGALADMALRIGAFLQENGVKRGDPVAVILPRGISQVAAVLGIQAAGAFYLPINVEQPLVRRDRILARAGARVVLCGGESGRPENGHWPERVAVLDIADAMAASPLDAPVSVEPEDTAYVIFTSGSTGEPKGVEVSHAAAWNTIQAINTLYHVSESDVALAVSALDFDLSVYDMFGLLAAGGALVLLREETRRDAAHWLSLVEEHRITIWNSVPTLLDMLLVAAEGEGRTHLPLRQVMLSGDWISLELPERLSHVAPDCGLVAMGGATEAAIWSNHLDVTLPLPKHWVSIPYGRALPNQVYRVMDRHGRDCPDWVPGELWIGGLGVAKGYRGDPALTGDRFVEKDGLRWYRTGDQGRFWADGTIEFLGRQDFQVKIRGHRIEMGEIESVLCKHPAVSSAVLTVQEGGAGVRRLAAHVVATADAEHDNLVARLTTFLEQRVPDYMVPPVWNILPRLPLTANGKVDRNVLAESLSNEMEEAAFAAPETQTQQTVAAIWRDVLKVDQVGLHDSFFALGGDSLLGTQLVAAIRRGMDTSLPLEKLFTLPTVAALADYIDAHASSDNRFDRSLSDLPTIVPNAGEMHEPFPLTEIQHAYWVGRGRDLELGNVATIFYYELDADGLDLDALARAWGKVVERHAMLRAVILPDGTQRILEEVPQYDFPTMDCSDATPDEQRIALEQLRESMTGEVMSADQWPLFDIRVSLLGQGKVRLHIRFDCLIVDAWSLLILIRDWHRFYVQPNADMPDMDLSFRDYVLAEQAVAETKQYRQDRAYWVERIASLPQAPELPLAVDPATIEAPRFQRRGYRLDAGAWERFKALARGHGLTPSGVLVTVYGEVLKQWSRNKRLTVNLTLFNRLPMHAQVQDIVGDFTSLTLLAVENEQEQSFLGRAEVLQRQLFRDLDHRSYNGVELLREIARQRSEFSRTAMPVVFTSALNMGSLGSDSGFGLLGKMGYSVSQTPQVWLDCQVYESDGGAVLTWDAVEGLFPEGMVDDMFAAFTSFIDHLVEDAGFWNEAVPSLIPQTQLERRREVNATEQPVSSELLHSLALKQATKTPDALAVVAPERSLMYRELADYAGSLGRVLRDKGAVPNRLVAVVMEKGWEQVVAVLGILASGAAYLPIDPALPARRIHHLLADADVDIVLTQSHLRDTLGWPEKMDFVIVDTFEPEKGVFLEPAQSPEDLAYVIYTSGSTGQPKGVMVDHRGAVNTILDINSRFGVGPEDRVLALSNLNFDLSVYDIFGLLAAGGTIVMPRPDLAKEPAHWEELIVAKRVSIWNTVPMMMHMFVEFAAGSVGSLNCLKVVLLSGDWIPLHLPEAIKALGKTVRVIGLGGATEASIWSNVFEVPDIPLHWKSIPYGKPMANQRYHVLDDAFRPVPDWVPGNLFIAGIGLAKGYWGDSEKTNVAFVKHPVTGERLYRTGDMGRYLADGNIEFLGREDTQVKVGGHRVELGEIESVLERHEHVERAVALTEGEPLALAAAVVLVPEQRGADGVEERVATFLEEYLPGYMVPKKIMVLDALPLNVNGKVDVKRIRSGLEGYHSLNHATEREAPRNELEMRLAAVWKSHLGVEDLSRNDDFFNLGGDSLKATRIIRQLCDMKIVPNEVSLRTFFSAPTIARFAEQVAALAQNMCEADEEKQSNYEEGVL